MDHSQFSSSHLIRNGSNMTAISRQSCREGFAIGISRRRNVHYVARTNTKNALLPTSGYFVGNGGALRRQN
jgi:hypothetical protein